MENSHHSHRAILEDGTWGTIQLYNHKTNKWRSLSAKRRKKYRCIKEIFIYKHTKFKCDCVISLIWYVQKDVLISFRMPWMVSMNGSTSSTTQSRRNHQLPMLHPSQRKWRSSTAWSSTTRNWSGGSAACWLKLRSVPSVVVVGYSRQSLV